MQKEIKWIIDSLNRYLKRNIPNINLEDYVIEGNSGYISIITTNEVIIYYILKYSFYIDIKKISIENVILNDNKIQIQLSIDKNLPKSVSINKIIYINHEQL